MAEQEQVKSSPPATSSPVRSDVGWKGAQRDTEVVRYRWQRDWTNHTSRSRQSREHWRRIRILTALGGAALLFGFLMYYLLYFPVRVPMLTIVETDYAWPLPPNAWAREDLEALKRLEEPLRKTMQISDGSPAWRTQLRGLLQFEQQLQQVAPQANRARLLVLYLSMHGAVNDDGEPCLLTRDSSPINSKTWLPLRVILERIGAANYLSDSVRKLVILDCSRQLTHWNSGQLYNGFSEQLPELLADAEIPNLFILNSTSPGQRAASSSSLGGSVFGHFLHLGLAGEADRASGGGNQNGRVSLAELVSYLENHVSHWTLHFRGEPQQPMLISARDEDFDVAWPLNRQELKQIANESMPPEALEPSVSRDKRNGLWSRRDQLWSARPYRFAPLAWRNFEHQLLWLEQLSESGSGYAALALKVYSEAEGRCTQLENELSQARLQPSLPNYVRAFADRPVELPRELPAHSLPMAAYLGHLDSKSLEQARKTWSTIMDGLSASRLVEARAQLQGANLPQPLSEGQFATFLDRYDLPSLWSSAPVMGEAFQMRDLAQRLDVPPPRNELPGDERAHYWIRSALNIADQKRREAEDRLLSATAPDDPLLRNLFSSDSYVEAEVELNEISEALSLRDEAWARVLYWAQWLARPQHRALEQEAANRIIQDSLFPLLATLHEFDDAIIRQEPDGTNNQGGSPWVARELTRELDRRMNAMRENCEQDLVQLLDSNRRSAARQVHDIEQWLALPLCTGDQRNALQEERQAILEILRNSFQPARPVPIASRQRLSRSGRTEESSSQPAVELSLQAEQDVGVPHLMRMASAWPTHPVRVILKLSETKSASERSDELSGPRHEQSAILREFQELGVQARQKLKMLARDEYIYGQLESEDALESSSAAPPGGPSGWNSDLTMEACCRAEALVRAAASFWFPSPKDDPTHRLRRRDLQQLLTWNARRVLDDCWGSAGLTSTPFFATVARNYLRGAESLVPPSPGMTRQIQSLTELLNARHQFFEQAFVVTASDILYVDESTATNTRMVLRSGPTWRANHDVLPDGEIVSFLRDGQGRLAETTRLLSTPDLENAGEEIGDWEFTLPGVSLSDRGPKMEAVATFRGNEYRAPLLLRLLGGRRLQIDLPPPGPAEITLQGAPRRRASIQFILDCSQSMAELEDVEAPGPWRVNQRPRMDLARNALEALLQQLAAEQQHRVGVRFFGHRVGWSVVESGKLLRQNRYLGEIPEGLQPYEDVELVLPLGRFDESALGTVVRHLRSVQPWGETPLYLSLIGALQDFAREDSDAERSIVVITDGVNYQFNPLLEQAKVADDVLRAAEGKRTAIHIIGFGIPPDEQAQARAEFSMIAEATGGSYLPANNASLLLRLLRDLLKPSEVQLISGEGDLVERGEVGTPLTVYPTPPFPQRYFFSFESLMTPLDLRGGERVQLQVSADRSRLESLRLGSDRLPQQSFAAPNSVLATTDPVGVRAMAHRPVRDDSGVRFTVSFQRVDRTFFARPAEVWGEIRPLFPPGTPSDQGSEPDYVFYDTVYAADQPNPVLNWFAERWPAGARQAEIRIWCRPTHGATPDDTLLLRDIADQVPRQGTGFTRTTVPGVSFQARTLVAGDRLHPVRVVVVERHQSGTSRVGDWRIDAYPRPRRMERRLDPAQDMALHTFYFEGTNLQDLENHELRFTSKARFVEEAWYLPEPILVDIADRSDLLQLSPTDSGR